MRYQQLLFCIPIALFFLAIVFQKPLRRYAAAYHKRLWIPVIIFFVGGHKGLLFFLPIYSIYYFFFEYKAAQAVADIATSKISSAAQGYVEIIGQGLLSEAALSPISRLNCLWYSYEHYKTAGWISRLMLGLDRDKWELVGSGSYDDIFAITDGTDTCYVNPKGAQVSQLDYAEWYEGNNFYKEARLLPRQDLYVLGNFITQNASQQRTELSQQVGALIAEWKLDQASFIKRFDLDGDGKVSEKELELVRAAAQREVRNKVGDLKPQTTISKPADGRPFIISHHSHSKLIKRHKLHSYFYIVLFIVSSAFLANMLSSQYLPQHKADEASYPKGWPALVLDPYRNTCTNLSGTYSAKSDAGSIKLNETFIRSAMVPQQIGTHQPFFRDWDTVTIGQHEEIYGAQKYGVTKLTINLQRSSATIQDFEAQLKAESADKYAEYQEMIRPTTRRKSQYFLPETQSNFIQPAQMTDEQFDNAIDDQFLWHTRYYEMATDGVEYDCRQGWVVTGIKSNDPKRPWLKVAVTKDQAGNLIARKFYTEPKQVAGVIFDDKIVILDWTRWPAAKPAWSAGN